MQTKYLSESNRKFLVKADNICDELSQQEEETKLERKYGSTLTREQTAKALGISISTLDRLIKTDDSRLFPKYFKIGKQYRFLVESVADFKQNNKFYGRKI